MNPDHNELIVRNHVPHKWEFVNQVSMEAGLLGSAVAEYTDDLCVGGTATASNYHSESYNADKLFDGLSTNQNSTEPVGSYPIYITYDFGIGNEKQIEKYTIKGYAAQQLPTGFMFQIYHGGSWQTLHTETNLIGTTELIEYTFDNELSSNLYRLVITDGQAQSCYFEEMEMMEKTSLPQEQIVPTISDKYKLALQLDTMKLYVLINHNPIEWKELIHIISLIDGGLGTVISDMDNSDPALAFDGNTNTVAQEHQGGAFGSSHYVGKDQGAGNEKIIEKVYVHSGDWGFIYGTAGAMYATLYIEGSNDNSSWDILEQTASFLVSEAVNSSGIPLDKEFNNLPKTPYRYHRVRLQGNSGVIQGVAGAIGIIDFQG